MRKPAPFPWRAGAFVPYRGVMISAVEENGRRFWSYRLPGEWRLNQETCSVADAMSGIDRDLGPKEKAHA